MVGATALASVPVPVPVPLSMREDEEEDLSRSRCWRTLCRWLLTCWTKHSYKCSMTANLRLSKVGDFQEKFTKFTKLMVYRGFFFCLSVSNQNVLRRQILLYCNFLSHFFSLTSSVRGLNQPCVLQHLMSSDVGLAALRTASSAASTAAVAAALMPRADAKDLSPMRNSKVRAIVLESSPPSSEEPFWSAAAAAVAAAASAAARMDRFWRSSKALLNSLASSWFSSSALQASENAYSHKIKNKHLLC